jgi:hypothetical protein
MKKGAKIGLGIAGGLLAAPAVFTAANLIKGNRDIKNCKEDPTCMSAVVSGATGAKRGKEIYKDGGAVGPNGVL